MGTAKGAVQRFGRVVGPPASGAGSAGGGRGCVARMMMIATRSAIATIGSTTGMGTISTAALLEFEVQRSGHFEKEQWYFRSLMMNIVLRSTS